MAKKRTKRVTKTAEPPARTRPGVNVNCWVDEPIGRAFEKIIATHRPRSTKRGHLEEALRDYCAKLGVPVEEEDAG
jgi:hypothetical protein